MGDSGHSASWETESDQSPAPRDEWQLELPKPQLPGGHGGSIFEASSLGRGAFVLSTRHRHLPQGADAAPEVAPGKPNCPTRRFRANVFGQFLLPPPIRAQPPTAVGWSLPPHGCLCVRTVSCACTEGEAGALGVGMRGEFGCQDGPDLRGRWATVAGSCGGRGGAGARDLTVQPQSPDSPAQQGADILRQSDRHGRGGGGSAGTLALRPDI